MYVFNGRAHACVKSCDIPMFNPNVPQKKHKMAANTIAEPTLETIAAQKQLNNKYNAETPNGETDHPRRWLRTTWPTYRTMWKLVDQRPALAPQDPTLEPPTANPWGGCQHLLSSLCKPKPVRNTKMRYPKRRRSPSALVAHDLANTPNNAKTDRSTAQTRPSRPNTGTTDGNSMGRISTLVAIVV